MGFPPFPQEPDVPPRHDDLRCARPSRRHASAAYAAGWQHFSSPGLSMSPAPASTKQLLKQATTAFRQRTGTDLTPVLRQLAVRLPHLKGAERRQAQTLLARPDGRGRRPAGQRLHGARGGRIAVVRRPLLRALGLVRGRRSKPGRRQQRRRARLRRLGRVDSRAVLLGRERRARMACAEERRDARRRCRQGRHLPEAARRHRHLRVLGAGPVAAERGRQRSVRLPRDRQRLPGVGVPRATRRRPPRSR